MFEEGERLGFCPEDGEGHKDICREWRGSVVGRAKAKNCHSKGPV